MKRPDSSGRGGHLGCSEGFNYNLYKPFLPYKQPNSQVSFIGPSSLCAPSLVFASIAGQCYYTIWLSLSVLHCFSPTSGVLSPWSISNLIIYVCVFTGERADAFQVRKALPQFKADELPRLYDFPENLFWIYKHDEQR